ncbi:hypothetical protein AC629_19950 [Bradyrhizobium sp. NAS80.1]|nr:hypothetical protein AC629_19950 [Bradyrhizobium sp. NAS80.1]
MAILGGLASDLPPIGMTHLSWDEFGARVLERRSSREPGRAAGPHSRILALMRKVLMREVLMREVLERKE